MQDTSIHSLCDGRFQVLKQFIPEGFTVDDLKDCCEDDFAGAVTDRNYKLLMRIFFRTVLVPHISVNDGRFTATL